MKAVLFDMDGVMFDTERLATEGWLYAAKVLDFNLTIEQCNSFKGANAIYRKSLFEKYFGKNVSYIDAYKLRTNYIDNFIKDNGVPIKEGLIELLNELKKNDFKIAVATSTIKEKAIEYFKSTNVLQYLDTFVCGDDVENSKPNPDIYLKAAEKLNVNITDCFVIEDSLNGIRAGINAGASVIMVIDMIKPDLYAKEKCKYIVNNLIDVIKIIKTK